VFAPSGEGNHSGSWNFDRLITEHHRTKVAEPKTNALPVLDLLARNQSVLSRAVVNREPQDPVWGMLVNVIGARYKSSHNGSEVYFCCARCKQAFDQQPEKYTLSVSR
jgi:YHS domain-containing protein